jgi:hypothetical protein
MREPIPGGWNRVHIQVKDLAAEVNRLRDAGLEVRYHTISGPGGSLILIILNGIRLVTSSSCWGLTRIYETTSPTAMSKVFSDPIRERHTYTTDLLGRARTVPQAEELDRHLKSAR